MPRVLILGAGISGLSIAYRLQQIRPDVEMMILEQRDRVGGSIWTTRRDGFQIEIGPNGFLDSKPSTLELSKDVALESHLVAASEVAAKNRYLFVNNHLKALPSGPLSFLQSDLLSWRGKAAFLMERFRAKRSDPNDESVYDFAVRRAGREAAEVFADALVTGIHAGDPRLLSIQASFPRIAGLEREFGSIIKGLAAQAKQRRREAESQGKAPRGAGRMWSLREGLRLLVEQIASRLQARPTLGVHVSRIHTDRQQPGKWLVTAAPSEVWSADALVLACPAYQQAALLADFDSELAAWIGGIPYNRVAVVALGFRQEDVPRHLNGFGYIVPQRQKRDLLGVQWCSTIFANRAPDGAVLLRAMCGGWHRADIVGWDDDRLLQAVRAEIHLALGITAAPILHEIIRWHRAIPQYVLGHLERVGRIQARAGQYPGLFLAGNAYYGVAMNDCTEQGVRVACQVARYLELRP